MGGSRIYAGKSKPATSEASERMLARIESRLCAEPLLTRGQDEAIETWVGRVTRLARIVEDSHPRRPGEPLDAWRERVKVEMGL